MKLLLYQCCLWFSIIMLGLWVGGTLFHILVVQPLWSYDPPASVNFFFTKTRFNDTIWNFYGPPWMLLRLLPLILCVITGWNIAGDQKKFLVIAISCWVFITA